MRRLIYFSVIVFTLFSSVAFASEGSEALTDNSRISPQSQACIGCHRTYTPGIVEDWLASRHSKTTPAEAIKKPALQRRVSADSISGGLSEYVVGCYECHSLNPERHKDNFQHMGYKINVVVSPNDCNACHPVEVKQYSESKKAHAVKNLLSNPVYHTLVDVVNGVKTIENGKIISAKPTEATLHDTCLGCHGTKVEVKGLKKIFTKMGEITVPDLTNWPNQGVGRENPDESRGTCTACHARHAFSIEVARKPYTCSQCHLEPDVPAWNVYKESKHGNIYSSKGDEWNFSKVPWEIGKDFKSPTCATCHNSLIVSPDGSKLAERNHDFGARLWVRVFGLIYSHPQPRSGNTTIIRNKDGLPLPTTFTGEPASEFLIDASEQDRRLDIMKSVCKGCHSSSWTDGHFAKLENTIKETNEMTLAATKLMVEAWGKGIEDKTNPFDEPIEQLWIKQWLFYSNSVRYASAMTGAPDYAAFKLGWWELTNNLMMMRDAIDIKGQVGKKSSPKTIKKK
ncbi:MAG: hydroxylamine oxidase [Nitrospirae bacterium]|nr:MAG: hydroxylamine oxidase [Nitrospirota bacterium]